MLYLPKGWTNIDVTTYKMISNSPYFQKLRRPKVIDKHYSNKCAYLVINYTAYDDKNLIAVRCYCTFKAYPRTIGVK